MKRALLITVIAAVLLSGCLDMFFPPANPEPTPIATRTPGTGQYPSWTPTGTAAPPLLAARVMKIDFDKPTYSAGDQVIPGLTIKNTGSRTITAEKVTVIATCVKLNDFIGNLLLQSKSKEERTRRWTFDYTETILPGETKVVSAIFNTQAEASGIRLAGDYDIAVTLDVNGRYADSRTVRMTLY